MKNFAIVCVLGLGLALSACETSEQMGGKSSHDTDYSAPYAHERTTGHKEEAPVSAERVFEQSQRK